MFEWHCWVWLSLVHSPDMMCNLTDQQTDQLDSQHMLLFRIETVPDQLDMKHSLFVQSQGWLYRLHRPSMKPVLD
jgi:hypothetical protein